MLNVKYLAVYTLWNICVRVWLYSKYVIIHIFDVCLLTSLPLEIYASECGFTANTLLYIYLMFAY